MRHWSVAWRKSLERTRFKIWFARAKALTQPYKMRSEHGLARLRADLFEEKTQLDADLLPIPKRFIAIRQERDGMLDQVSDIDKLFNGGGDFISENLNPIHSLCKMRASVTKTIISSYTVVCPTLADKLYEILSDLALIVCGSRLIQLKPIEAQTRLDADYPIAF